MPVTWSPHQTARNACTQLRWLVKIGCNLIVFRTATHGWTVNWNLDADFHVQNSRGLGAHYGYKSYYIEHYTRGQKIPICRTVNPCYELLTLPKNVKSSRKFCRPLAHVSLQGRSRMYDWGNEKGVSEKKRSR